MKHKTLQVVLLIWLWLNLGSIGHTQQVLLNRPAHTVLDLEYSPDGLYMARVYASGRLEVVDIDTDKIVIDDSRSLASSLLKAKVSWSPTSEYFAAGIGAQVFIWDIKEMRLLHTLNAGNNGDLIDREADYSVPEGFSSLQWSSDSSLLMAQSLSSRYTVWSQEQQVLIFDEIIGNNPIPVVWRPDNRSISSDLVVLDIFTHVRTQTHAKVIPWVNNTCGNTVSLATSLDRMYVIAGTGNGCIVLMEAITGDQTAAYKVTANNDPVWDVSWSPDNNAVMAVTDQGSVIMTDLATGDFAIAAQTNGSLFAVDWSAINLSVTYGGHTEDNQPLIVTLSSVDIEQIMESNMLQQPELSSTPITR